MARGKKLVRSSLAPGTSPELSGALCPSGRPSTLHNRRAALALLALLAPLLMIVPASAQATGNPQSEDCSADEPPTPMAVEVTAVPVVIESTTADYFVLYVSHDLDGSTVEFPVLAKSGEAGATTLAENVEALPADRYRVEKYLLANPADVDRDCIDDITELDSLGSMNPVNPAGAVALIDGAVAIPDRATQG